MKIVGLITEYNPFHNGHLYHIQQAREITGADSVIVVMSGDYVQRGIPALIPKHLRAEMALKCGVSAVFELPVCYATGSAETFALGAVSLLDQLGVVDSLCFGSECGNLSIMKSAADILSHEPEEYKLLLKKNLKNGLSFPKARQDALASYLSLHGASPESQNVAEILEDPNNILGIEYLKALRKLNSSIRPYTILRQGSHYHDNVLSASYSSASAIRTLLAYSGSSLHTEPAVNTFDNTSFLDILDELEGQIPSSCLALLKDYHRVQYPIYQNDFSLLLKYKLLNKTPSRLMRYMDVSEELANRICGQLNLFFNYKQFCELLKTRELTQTRINRALLHIMLGTKKEEVRDWIQSGYHYYARLLGIRKDREKLLSLITEKSAIPLLARLSDCADLPPAGQRMLHHDILASNLYTSVITDKYKTAFLNEHKQPLLKV